MTRIGLVFPPDQPPERLRQVAVAVDDAGLDELWLWEDCFAESGLATATAALAWTSNVQVGVGLLPVPLRNAALTAMELATIARLFPGRLLPGIGHGVQDWMRQVGAAAASPLTLLGEYATALRRLLAGDEVAVDGRYVHLDRVRLAWPPAGLPVLVGATGPKTLHVAGEVGDGVIFTGGTTPDQLADGMRIASAAFADAGRDGTLEAVAFASVPVDASADQLVEVVAGLAAAGADRVAVCGLGEAGPPDGSERLLDLVPVLAGVADRLRRGPA